MKLNYLLLILIVSMGVTPAFAQEAALFVTTDKTSYSNFTCDDEIEQIIISGYVRNIFPDVPVTLKVISPNGNIISIDQLDISEDKTFNSTLGIGGAIYLTGTYTMHVQYGYGSAGLKSQSTFEYQQAPLDACGFGDDKYTTIFLDGDELSYFITGGKLLSITPDMDSNSLILQIQAIEDGSITMVIPRNILDSKNGDKDSDFIVLVDMEEELFDETTSATHRTLTIPFLAGAEQIEIIGTFVIPEFGVIAMMIMGISTVSIIVATRSKFRIIYE